MELNDQPAIEETIILNQNENKQTEQYLALKPHTYPTLMRMSFRVCCLLFVICLFNFPYYFELNQRIKTAHTTMQNEEYFLASIQFSRLCNELPNNKRIKLYHVHFLFKCENIPSHMTAMNTLATMTLNKDEWNELLNYMPTEYVQYFHDVKKDKS